VRRETLRACVGRHIIVDFARVEAAGFEKESPVGIEPTCGLRSACSPN